MLTHTDLCRLTAEKFCKAVAIYEVKAQEENPDVITFYTGGTSIVFEIKMSAINLLSLVNECMGKKKSQEKICH